MLAFSSAWALVLAAFPPARHPQRRTRCTESCNDKHNRELDRTQVAADQGTQTCQDKADEQENSNKGEGNCQSAVQRFSFVGRAMGAASVVDAERVLFENRSGHAR